jgi:hypothetical protein
MPIGRVLGIEFGVVRAARRNACTRTDTCMVGTCVGSNPVTCTPLDACHLVGVCNAASGTCSKPNAVTR